MEEFLIVDGYNILHAWPSMQKLMAVNIEHARLKLIEILSNYQALKGYKIILVFDAHYVKGSPGKKETEAGIEVIYSPEGTPADLIIEKLTADLAQRGPVMVATSDWLEQRMVFGKGAIRLSARELEQEVKITSYNLEPYFAKEVSSEGHLSQRISSEAQKALEKWRRKK